MPASTVRAALQSYFLGAGIPGLQQVYLDEPVFWAAEAWDLSAGNGSGAVAFVHFNMEQETRLARPAYTGQKQVDYQVGLAVQYKYLIAASPLPGAVGDEWVGPLDDLLDGIRAAIRADANLGTGLQGPIREAGQGPNDIRIARDLPKTSAPGGGAVLSWNVVEFDLCEIVTA